jgi:purine-cytosine permease-like protein
VLRSGALASGLSAEQARKKTRVIMTIITIGTAFVLFIVLPFLIYDPL